MFPPGTSHIFETLTAVFLTLLVGFVLQRRKLPIPEFWPGVEQITYYLLFPALLFTSIISAEVEFESLRVLVIPFTGPFLVMGLILFLGRKHLGRDYSAFTSIFQGSIRFNTYIGFSIALSVFGLEGVSMAAMFIALVIPMLNVMSVAVLSGTSGSSSAVNVIRHLARNPLIIACVFALTFKGLSFGLPTAIFEFLSILGRASLPLGLMAVGAALCFQQTSDDFLPLSFVSINKLLMMPVLMFASCQFFGVTGLARSIAILFAALPGSPAAYVLARQMGGDHRLMANLFTVQILVSAVTLPLVLALEAVLPQ